MADGPLERLLRTHREPDHGAQMIHAQLAGEQAMHGSDVVADRGDGEARTVERLGRIARRRRTAVAEELGEHEKVTCRVERAVRRVTDQPVVTGEAGHVV